MEEVAFLWLFNLRECCGGADTDMVRVEHGIRVLGCDSCASSGPEIWQPENARELREAVVWGLPNRFFAEPQLPLLARKPPCLSSQRCHKV